MLRLYDYLESGNGYKVRLLLHQLALPFERIELDITRGETRTPEFLARNPNGRIPLLELPDGSHLAESNAICFYLAEGTPFLPSDALLRARVLQWMCFEQYSHEPYIAVARFIVVYLGNPPEEQDNLESKRPGGYKALKVMNLHLETNDFFANNRYSIADIALYAYTHKAHEGGFSLVKYPNIREWLKRVENQAGFIPMLNRH